MECSAVGRPGALLSQRFMKLRPLQLSALALFVFAIHSNAQERLFPQVTSDCPLCTKVDKAPLSSSVQSTISMALRKRQYPEAEEPLLEEVRKNPKSPQLLNLLGDIFFLDGKYINSAVALKKSEALAPLDNHSRFLLAMCYVIMKHGEWAMPELRKLERAEPKNALYPYWISRIYYHDMHLDDAVANAKKAIQLDPNFMQAYNNLGLYQEALGKDDEAIQSYKAAIRLNETRHIGSPWPLYNLGKLLCTLGRTDDAETYLKSALKEAPGFPKAHFQLGLLLEKKNLHSAAIEELKLAIANDPSYAQPYYVLGRVYTQIHQPAKAKNALAHFEKLKKQQVGDSPEPQAARGDLPDR